MPQYIKKIRTGSGDLQIDYEALANLPELGKFAAKDSIETEDLSEEVLTFINDNINIDTTLAQEGVAADAKTVGDKFAQIESALDAYITDIDTLIGGES